MTSDLPAESDLLCAALTSPDAAELLADTLAVKDFAAPVHGRLWSTIMALRAKGQPVDEMGVRAALGEALDLATSEALEAICGSIVSTRDAHLLARAEHLRDLASVRAVMEVCRQIVAEGESGVESPKDFVSRAEQAISLVVADRSDVSRAVSLANGVVEQMSKWAEGRKIDGYDTGFRELDYVTGGAVPGLMQVVAGRPGMGKTSFALALAIGATKSARKPAFFASIEMPLEQLALRAISSQGQIHGERLRHARLSSDDLSHVRMVHADLEAHPIYVDDSARQTVLDVRRNARRLQKQFGGLSCVVVDYLQRVRPVKPGRSREEEVRHISEGLTELAKELRVPVIALSQLNREGERGATNKRPDMSQLRESGSIEQDAAVVMLLYRDEVYNTDTQDKGVCEVIVGKNRNGATGTVRLAFEKQFTRFSALEQQAQEYRHDPW